MTSKKKIIVQYVILAFITLIVVFPLFWLIMLSFMDNSTIMSNPLNFPDKFDFVNYKTAIQSLNIGTLYKNTIINSIITLVIEIPLTFAGAFALTRLDYKNKRLRSGIYTFMLLGLAISPFILLFPTYKINRFFGLNDTLSLVMPYLAASISFNTLLFSNYLKTIPSEIDEAALIDGATLPQLVVRVIAPIAKPVMATIIIFNLLYIWNEYPFASIMISDQNHFTLSRGIAFFKGKYNINYAGIAAYSVMIILPELLIYGIFQKNVMEGMTLGAVKG